MFIFSVIRFINCTTCYLHNINEISGVMVSVLPSSAVDRGFEPRSGQTKNYKISICCFSAMRTTLGNKNKDWLVLKQFNVSE